MLRYFTPLIFICLFATTAKAQDDDALYMVEEPDPFIGRFMLDAGITKMRPWKLNDALFGSHQFDQLITVGFTTGFADETHPDSEDFIVGTDLSYGFHLFLPVEMQSTAGNGDLVNYRLKGWEVMTSSIAVNLLRNEHVDFVCGIGLFMGNMKLSAENRTANTEPLVYRNPFVAPMLRTELRFNVWHFTFGTRISYRHDVTNEKWKRKDEGLDPLPGYAFREMQFMVYFGLRQIE